MLVLLVLLVLLPLILVQAVIYTAWYVSRWRDESRIVLAQAEGIQVAFEAYVTDLSRHEMGIGEALLGLLPHTPQQASRFLVRSGRHFPSVQSWNWISPEGKIAASSRADAVGIVVADRPYFQAVRGGRPSSVSDILKDRTTGKEMFVVCSRISDPQGEFRGAVSAVVGAVDFAPALLPRHRADDVLTVYDAHGVLVYSSSPADKASLDQDVRNDDPLLAQTLASRSAQVGPLAASPGGERCIAARVPLAITGWVAGARRPAREAMATVYRTLWAPVAANLAVAVVSGLLAMRLGGRLIAQLRQLQEHAQALSRGQWEHAAEPAAVRELAELSAAFNQMGAAIRQRTAQLESANQQLEGEIAERQAAQESLQRAADQLTRSNQELEQFAYIASHDLQEPLRVVTGYVQLIERKYKTRLDAEADQFMDYIREGVSRMQQLITDLLSYSRLGTRGKPFGRVKVETVLEHATTNLQPLIDQNGAVVAHQALPEVQGDEMQLVQLFQNLIANAVKFHGDRRPEVSVSARPENGHWVFEVRDNGIGIERQYWDQIFVIFQRLHTRQKYPGTGIGLAVCKRIVERHGGRIWLDSQPNLGTTFYFTLPSEQ